MMNTIHVGLDPGLNGAVGAIYPDGRAEGWHTPTVSYKTGRRTKSGNPQRKQEYDMGAMTDILQVFADIHQDPQDNRRVLATIEDVHARPKDGKRQAMSFGRGRGIWEGIVAALRLPKETASPSHWRPALVGRKKDKSASLLLAKQLFPDVPMNLAKDEAIAEALLIAEYMRRRMSGELRATQSKKKRA